MATSTYGRQAAREFHPSAAVTNGRPRRSVVTEYRDLFGNPMDVAGLSLRERLERIAQAFAEWDRVQKAQLAAATPNAFGELMLPAGSRWKAISLADDVVNTVRSAHRRDGSTAYIAGHFRPEYRGLVVFCSMKSDVAPGQALALGELFDVSPMTPVMARALHVDCRPHLSVWSVRDVRAISPFPVRGYPELWDLVVPAA